MRRLGWIAVCAVLAGCPKGNDEVPDAGPADAGPDMLSEKEPNERPDQALALTRDAVVSAALSADPSKVDEDWYRLAPGSARNAEINVTGIPGGDVMIEVYDRDRNRLGSVNSEGEGKPERLPNLYVEGERFVRIASARKGSGGAYTLTLSYRRPSDGEEREPNDRAVDAHPLALGQAVAAYVGHAGDADWYRIELPAPAEGATPPPGGETAAAPAEEDPNAPTGTGDAMAQLVQTVDAGTAAAPAPVEPPGLALKIELTGVAGVRPELEVLSAAEASLFSLRGKESEPLTLRNIGVRSTDKVVYVVVKSGWLGSSKDKEARRTYNAKDAYTLTVSLEEAGANAELEPNDELHKATPLQGAGFKEGFLAPKSDVDHFVLRTTEPVLAKVELSGVERLDLILSAVEPPVGDGAAETVVLKANAGEVKEPERLNNVSCNGTCYFRVEGASRKVEGKWVKDFENADLPYRLTVTTVPDNGGEEREPNNTVDRGTELAFGKAVRGTVYPAKDVDYYRLDLTDRPVRSPIRATLLGILKVDVGLYLHRVGEDGKPALVQTADRAKGDQPENIRYSLEPGLYVFEVRDTKNRESNFQDAYQLTVEEGE